MIVKLAGILKSSIPRWNMSNDGGDLPPIQGWVFASQITSSLVGPVLIGLLLDWQLGWRPWGTLAGIGLGLLCMLTVLIVLQRRSGE